MTAYKKNVLAWVCIMVLALSMVSGAMNISKWFLLPFFVIIFTAQFFLERIKCPNCGTPVTYQGTFAGIRIRGGFIRKKCQKCGWDLRKPK
jgi:ribosomal protein S27E